MRGVEVLETFAASAAEVARLRVGADTVIAKLATGDGLAAARREVQFFEQLAPGWSHPAPQYLGAHDTGDAVLLLTEDLAQTGYRVVGTAVSDEQLYGAIDVIAGVHAHFWGCTETPEFEPSVTSSSQAWPPDVITRHALEVRQAADEFFARTTELERSERAVLDEVLANWEPQFQARVAGRQHLTLIHGDFHFLGNVFFVAGNPRPKVIDWSELKPGLAPHDLAYSLSALPSRQADAADLLRHYWKALDVPDYSWELCSWDFRFSLFSNLFQSVFQQSVKWYRASLTALDALYPGLRPNPGSSDKTT
ncbi:aminoglycoside phosphotransferase family protein [Kribbella sp. GL6]|uniref:aminoglycoside phosphotransferase family protein n=1 Tax=Kribbella sp. GL6 TaxID=3419765 RepID=UPI003CFBD621